MLRPSEKHQENYAHTLKFEYTFVDATVCLCILDAMRFRMSAEMDDVCGVSMWLIYLQFEIIFNLTSSVWFLTNGSQSILINNANSRDAITNEHNFGICFRIVLLSRNESLIRKDANTHSRMIAASRHVDYCAREQNCAFAKYDEFAARRRPSSSDWKQKTKK